MTTSNFKVLLTTTNVPLFLGLTFSPAIATISWHLWHNGQMDYGGAHLPCPVGGPPVSAQLPSISKSAPLLSLWVPPYWLGQRWHLFLIPRTNSELEAFYTSFAATYWTQLLREQEIQQGPIRVGTANQEAFCMQSVLKDRRDWFHVSCLVSRGTWSVDFQGCSKDKVEFFLKVLGIPDVLPQENHSDPPAG